MTQRSAARPLLLPLTPIYRLGLALRSYRLNCGWEPARRLRCPVISIGNLSTGGAGKTPLAIALAKALSANGFAVDVLSRGYGRQGTVAARVDSAGEPEEYGDEPLLIARDAGVPVYVARERYEAGLMAEGSEERSSGAKAASSNEVAAGLKSCPDSEDNCVHILDDGFQHRQLHRDVDILLLNREDWEDRLLPAGNLREPLNAARRAHVIAVPDNDADLERELRGSGWTGPVWRLRRHMDIPPTEGPVLAFCGIARPHQFFAGLEAAGLRLTDRIAFRDHHRYTPADLRRLQSAARATRATVLMTTAKDDVRIRTRPSGDGTVPVLTAALRVEIVDERSALDWLTRRLAGAPARPSL